MHRNFILVSVEVNFSTISGPLESEVLESYKINNGFHFGVEGLYSFNDYFSAGAEIQYSQIGAKYKYQGPSYYIFSMMTVISSEMIMLLTI